MDFFGNVNVFHGSVQAGRARVALNVDVPWDRCTELRPQVGDTADVAPRQVRLFVQEYAI